MKTTQAGPLNLPSCEARTLHFFRLPLIGGALITLDRQWLDINTRLCDILGYTQAELRQRPWATLVHADDQAQEASRFARLCTGAIDHYTVELRLLHKDGHPLWTQLSMGCVRHEHAAQSFAVAAVHDISLYKDKQEQLHALAFRDPLTGLLNRRGFTDALHHLWNLAARQHAPLALLALDLDQFKAVNDTHGHLLGDQVLTECAARMRACLRTADRICRYGGDEFMAILPWTDTSGAQAAATRLRTACDETDFCAATIPLRLTVSIGSASTTPTADTSPETLIAHADHALYLAKQRGRNE
jgi:diguanylate cyclase (GGDEF)-like protein/PAS domain S-box-containing protein